MKFCEYCGVSINDNTEAFNSKSSDHNVVTNISKKKKVIITVILLFVLLVTGIVAYLTYEQIQIKRGADEILSLMDGDSDDDHYVKEVLTTVSNAINSQKTTSKTTESETVTTTVTKNQKKTEESEIYLIYLAMLNEIDAQFKREYGAIPYYQYYLYDINHDSIYELLVHVGESEAEAFILIFSVDENGELIDLGEIGGEHTLLVEKDRNLYTDLRYMGYQIVEKVIMMEDLGSWIIVKNTVFEGDNSGDYKSYGTAIKGYDISDTSAIEELCPKELLEAKPYVNAYVKTYDFSGRGGFESRLYLDGDFAYVLVESRYDIYDSYDFKEYAYDETSDGIVVYQGSSEIVPILYITPYSESGVAGDIVTCNIPTNASETIKTGAFSYALNREMKGQINCHEGTVAGFTTDYVVNGEAVSKVRSSLGDKWHVTAKNICDNYGITWYELWDSDDGDYYGWVDSSYIDFY